MLGKICGIILTLSSVVACAQPKYEVVNSSEPAQPASESKLQNDQCQAIFNNSGYCLMWQWEIKPTSKVQGSLNFKILRANALDQSPIPVDAAEMPEVVLWMPSMGHGSSPTTVSRIDVGTYRAQNVYFIMPGQWEIHFLLKQGEQTIDEAVVNINY